MCPAVTKDTRAEAPVCPLCTEAFRVGSACLCALATTLSVMIPESQVAEPFPMAQGSVPAYTVIGPQFTTNPHFLLPLGKVGPTTARQEGSAAWMQDLCPEQEPEATSQSPSLPLVLWSIGGPTGLGYQGSCQVPWLSAPTVSSESSFEKVADVPTHEGVLRLFLPLAIVKHLNRVPQRAQIRGFQLGLCLEVNGREKDGLPGA